MRRTISILLMCVPALACAVTNPPEGRWEGSVEIPGRPLQMVVDLAQDGAGAWTGSIIVQGLAIKGARLSNIVVADHEVTFDLGTSLAGPTGEPAGFKATLAGADGMAGEMRQGGNTAKFALKRIAPARVEMSVRNTAVASDLADRWTGEFELGGYPRQVTITLENHADAGATAQFVIVGKQTNDLPVDVVTEEHGLLRIESLATRVAFEGRFFREQGEIRGIVELGPMELPLVLRRATGEGVMKALLGLAIATMLASFGVNAQSGFRGDATHAGTYRGEGPREFHRVKWKFPTGDRIVSSPVYADGTIYFGSDDGNVYAVDARDGQQLWKRRTGGPVAASPAIAGGVLYVGSYDGKFYALDARTGAPRWKFATGGERRFEAKGLHGLQPKNQTIADPFDVYLSSPVVAAGSVYFGSGDGNVYALDAVSGGLQWKFATGDVVHASPAYADGVVFFGSWDSYFYAVDARTGKEKWRFHGGEDPVIHNQVGFQSSPAVVNGVVYTGCRDSNLYALDAETGKEQWRFNNGGSWVVGSPAVAQGKVIFGTSDSSLYLVLDAQTGKNVVQQKDRAYMFSSPSVAGKTVFIGVLNGTLEARDLDTGSLLWEFQTDASRRNEGWALTADRQFNSALLYWSSWREVPLTATAAQFGVGSIFSSPLVAGGVVYFGSADGNLYALE